MELEEGNEERALALAEESAELCRVSGHTWFRARSLWLVSDLLARRGDVRGADARLCEALPLVRAMHDRPGTLAALSRLSELAARLGDAGRAGLLLDELEAEQARG